MRLRRRHAPLLLLAIPVLVKAGPIKDHELAASEPLPRDVASQDVVATGSSPTKPDVGTEDAPIDGLDGKPHAGPFIESSPSRKKPPARVEDIGGEDAASSRSKGDHGTRPSKSSSLEPEDGVMNDPNREAPKKGTTGTEGGVSEKDKNRKAQEASAGPQPGKKPEPPKEARPLPHSEEEKISGSEKTKDRTADKDEEKPKGAPGLEKPEDLPDKPYDVPHPAPPGSSKSDPLDTTKPVTKEPTTSKPVSDQKGEEGGVIQPFHSFVLAFTMILFSEIGDKTFLVAALMAMRHPRMVVFSAAFSALIAMTILSAVLGHAVPAILSEKFTHFAAALLFLVFGAKMVREGFAMSPEEGVGEEMKEVEMELEEKEHLAARKRRRSSISPYILEAGRGRRSRSAQRIPTIPRSPSSSPSHSPSPSRSSFSTVLNGLNNLLSLLLSPAWVQTFVMTFLGEWGDRSQIATIAMAAGQDYWWVTGGAISGHAICTGVAVIGGRAIAGRVSLRVVTLGGAFAFLAFGFIYLVEAAYS